MKTLFTVIIAVCLIASSGVARAQTPAAPSAQAPAAAAAPDAMSKSLNKLYQMIKKNLTETAAKATDELYTFKPTPDVRSFAELLGHVADAQYMFCSLAKGEASPSAGSIEKTKTAKADIQKALDDSFTYCDAVYAGMTDAMAAQSKNAPKFMGGQAPAGEFLAFNIAHDNEHYGNLVTYMRLKGVVPPSSDRTPRKPAAQ